jgi:LysR family transcriptional regulator, carnitine catabolism transcriptional activator
MDSRRLQYFVAVADHQGFSAAAKEVFVSQPALSLAVRELEDELGTPLFFRVGRRIALTPAGQALLGPARQLLHDLDVGRAAVAAVVGLEAGTLAICCLPTLAADPLAELIGSFRQTHPGIVIDLAAPEDTDEVVALIRDGSCEVGVATGVGASDLEQHPLGNQDLFVIFPPGTRRPRRTVALAELAGVPMIAAPKGTSTRRLLEEGFAATGSTPQIAVVSAQRDAILPLVLSGAGAALVPEPMASVAGRLGAVVARPAPPISREITLLHRPGPQSPAAQRFVELSLA